MAMPGPDDLEQQLAALRRLIALGKPGDYTPLEVLQLRRECQRLWAEIETRRREQLTSLVPPGSVGRSTDVA